ncbi:PAX3- and PAX7-binding protein 1-like [Limulus polyphemus]|uniref:PAX3- and PAX7-binding protein 1-like n=1 Tax=Limulus polyphemus TaxID=6850 RepID=A0ABM1BMD7_LIMPO|nr:PAX3- and PAX7-binding protein 1-like [Limulus polyphemus]
MSLFKKPKRNFRQRIKQCDSDNELSDEEKKANSGNLKEVACEIGQNPKEVSLDTESQNKLLVAPIEKEQTGLGLTLTGVSSSGIGLVLEPNAKENETSNVAYGEKPDINYIYDGTKSRKNQPATKLLSFHDEEDEVEVFKVKKSHYSRRLAKQQAKEKKKRQEKDEKLDVPTLEEGDKTVDQMDDKDNRKEEPMEIVSGKEAEEIDEESDSEEKQEAKKQLHSLQNLLSCGNIPDAATIFALKKQRQLAREMGDFIPVDDNESKSRLIRDDDNDQSEDEEEGRINFTGINPSVQRQQVKDALLSAENVENEELEHEDAAELERWEREQIRKGVGITQGVNPREVGDSVLLHADIHLASENEDSRGSSHSFRNGRLEPPRGMDVPPTFKNKETITTEDVKARLQDRLIQLENLYETHCKQQTTCQNEILAAEKHIKELEIEKPVLSEKFRFYQEMRNYIKDLEECLDIKLPQVTALETKIHNLLKKRAQWLVERRHQDVKDEAEEYSTMFTKTLRGPSLAVQSDKPNIFDETKLLRKAEREGRRMRRRKARESKYSASPHYEGMSSDDEEPETELVVFNKQKEAVLQNVQQIFEDVVEDFGTITGIQHEFEMWKTNYPESYDETYVPLCLPKIFGPFIRLSLISWNPLEEPVDLESMSWYQTLAFYSLLSSEDEDPDLQLIPKIVEKVVLPKLSVLVGEVWDPLSTTQTLHLVTLTTRLLNDYPTVSGSSKHLQTFLQKVVVRIRRTLDEDVFLPLYPKEILEHKGSSGALTFFQRQSWSCVKVKFIFIT